jgi:translation initiation factor 1
VASGRARRGTIPPDAGPGAPTRLVYSTGGETAPDPAPPRSPSPQPAPRGAGPVRLRLERRASGRTVTVLTGLSGTPAQIADLARELRTLCGAGGTVREGAVELQGDQRETAAAALVARGLRVKR